MVTLFPSIEQFRSVVRAVSNTATYVGKDENGEPIYDGTRTKPKVTFTGTVKVHGTNAGITRRPDGTFFCQSRSRALTDGSDNMGFRAWVEALPAGTLEALFQPLVDAFGPDVPLTVYGEWAGRGIQAGVAVSQVDRFFYIFNETVGVDGAIKHLLPLVFDAKLDPSLRIVFASQIYQATVNIDFNDPVSIANVQNTLGEITLGVEQSCPVGRHFGVNGIGEGVVWIGGGHTFKVKGEKHSASKVKTLAPADVERVQSIAEFVENTVTENRLKQGLAVLQEQGKPIDKTSLGDYLRWVSGDVNKEEADTLAESGLTMKDVGSALTAKARQFFFQHIGP